LAIGSLLAVTSPAQASDGTLYIGGKGGFRIPSGRRSRLIAIDPSDGSILWSYEIGCYSYSTPLVGLAGTIYQAGLGLFAINPDGTQKWWDEDNYLFASATASTSFVRSTKLAQSSGNPKLLLTMGVLPPSAQMERSMLAARTVYSMPSMLMAS
jgi:outer membrane protein assembly factor BamB